MTAQAQGLWKEIVEPALEGWLDSERAKALDAAKTERLGLWQSD